VYAPGAKVTTSAASSDVVGREKAPTELKICVRVVVPPQPELVPTEVPAEFCTIMLGRARTPVNP